MDNEQIYCTAYTGNDKIPAFITFCIEQYKNYKKISGERAMSLISEAGVLEYLAEHYDTLHLESPQWILNDIDNLVKNKTLLK